MTQTHDIHGFRILHGFLSPAAQDRMVQDIRAVVAAAPLFRPETRFGRPMSVRMTAAGRFGWISDRRGYRYSPVHPQGQTWPDIPGSVLEVWRAVARCARDPECCLVNWYAPGARMGLHQDRDEADMSAPVVSISLGDDGLFRVGQATRAGKTKSVWLRSGDVVVMGGEARLKYHGVDRIAAGTSTLLGAPGRINLTLRVVT